LQRYILTGAPGAGKTSVLHALRDRGYPVVTEAATDHIGAEHARGNDRPWADPQFIEDILALQRARLSEAVREGTGVQFHDRSPVCTLALARHLGYPVSAPLQAEVDRLVRDQVYARQVFFVRPLGFIEPTAARRISYEDSLRFERIHEVEYQRLGFELVDVPAGPVADRATLIETFARRLAGKDG
jgi:predicted ATPase